MSGKSHPAPAPAGRKGVQMFHVHRMVRTFECSRLWITASIVIAGGCAAQNSIPSPSSSRVAPYGGSTGAAAAFLGCPYPSGNVYQHSVVGASPDPNSAAYIAATIAGGGGGGFQAWIGTQ